MKKILFLGGSQAQVSAIKKAKELGLYVITCDYLPENPGHFYSDKYYNISTIETEKILEIAVKEKIDAISSYASEPGAYTAAYVSEKLILKGSGTKAVNILSNKNEFRYFLKKHKFNSPRFQVGTNIDDFKNIDFFPGILKPIDSSGSKGVLKINSLLELQNNFEYTLSFSKSKTLIYEEYIERYGPQIHGEVFVVDGKISVFELGDQYFSPVSPMTPYSTVIPTVYHQNVLSFIKNELQKVINILGFKTGGMNVEVIRDKNDKIYFVEIGTRSGGNYMPELIYEATGINIMELNIISLINDSLETKLNNTFIKKTAQIIFHAFQDGYFNKINLPSVLKNKVKDLHYLKQKKEEVLKYRNSKDVVAVGIFDVNDIEREEFENILKNHEFIV